MSTIDALKTLLEEEFEVDTSTMTPQSNFIDAGLDSLSIAELMFLVEDRFGIEFPDEQSGIATVAELVALIDRLRVPPLARAA